MYLIEFSGSIRHAKLANYIAMLHTGMRQDSIFFIGTNIDQIWLDYLVSLGESIFRSNCPIFMNLGLSYTAELKLDSNIIFYEWRDSNYNLVDKFAVRAGPPIVLQLGTWFEGKGVTFESKMNRWDRRTNLNGAKFVNTLAFYNGFMAYFIYNQNGTIIGSDGWFQEILFYITGKLNLTIETRSYGDYRCQAMMVKESIDVCSQGAMIASTPYYHRLGITFPMVIHRQAQTLIAGVKTSTAPDAWVYTEVFDAPQWLIFISLLLFISITMSILHFISKRGQLEAKFSTTYEGLVMTSLFVIQQGSHPGLGEAASKRILALATAILTMLVFIYYSNDITSKMTAGSSPTPVRTFDDVLDKDYEVISVGHSFTVLTNNKVGSAKHSVYKRYFEEAHINIAKYQTAVFDRNKTYEQFIEEGGKELPSWFEWNRENLNNAVEQIVNDPKKLFFCAGSCFDWAIRKGKAIPLKMDDTSYSLMGFHMAPDSEFLGVFNHYLLKAFETGILHKVNKKWNEWRSKPPIKIGLTEPEPLKINNVMFPFSFLAAIIILSVIAAVMEKAVQTFMMLRSKPKRSTNARSNNKIENIHGREGKHKRGAKLHAENRTWIQ